ncbi:hypothetical protein Fcan01_20989, partial [Folsomia candida]
KTMSACVFCTEASVATTATSTTMEAFPFLCAQVGVPPTATTGRQAPAALCSTCHNLWEEATLLYSNMQGLLNLMGRRVTSIKQRIGVRKQDRTRAASPSRPEAMMNWWYPQQLPVTNNTQIDNSTIANTNVESNTDIKVESIDDIEDCLDLGEDMDLEDVEIMPDPGHENEDNDGDDDGGDDDLNDPNYDPNEDEATTSKSDGGKPKPTPRQAQPGQDYPPVGTLVSARGRPMISVNNFLYNFRSTSTTLGKSLWTCDQAHGKTNRARCMVRVHTTDDPINPKYITEMNTHNHPPCAEGVILIKKVMNKIRTAALTTTDTPPQITKMFKQELEFAHRKNGRKVSLENIKRSIRGMRSDAAAEATMSSEEVYI